MFTPAPAAVRAAQRSACHLRAGPRAQQSHSMARWSNAPLARQRFIRNAAARQSIYEPRCDRVHWGTVWCE